MDIQNDFYITKPLTFKYTFRINRENYDYYQIRRDLSRSLVDFYENYRLYRDFQKDEYFDNVTYFILNDLFRRRFSFTGNTNAYLTDYSESSGSLIISFTVLVVGAITNYGSIRETIDYFAEDIERVLSNSLNKRNDGYTITSSIQEQNNQNSNSQVQAQQLDTSQYNSLLAKIKVDRVLIGTVFFVLMLSLIQNYILSTDNSKQIDIDEIKVKNIIQEELRNQKIDDFLKLEIDTVYVQKK